MASTRQIAHRAIREFVAGLEREPYFFHYPMTNEEWGKLVRRERRAAVRRIARPENERG